LERSKPAPAKTGEAISSIGKLEDWGIGE